MRLFDFLSRIQIRATNRYNSDNANLIYYRTKPVYLMQQSEVLE